MLRKKCHVLDGGLDLLELDAALGRCFCEYASEPCTVKEPEPVYTSKNACLCFGNQKEGIFLRIRKRAMTLNFCVLSQFTL